MATEKPITVIRCGRADDPRVEAVAAALSDDIQAQFGPVQATSFNLIACDEAGRTVAGLLGTVHWRWLYIQRFWVAPAFRGAGLGRRLLREAEAEARATGVAGLYLDTFDDGASRFYTRCGFRQCGEINNFPPGLQRRFFAST